MRKEELMEAPWKRNLHDTPKRQRVSIAFIC